MRLRLLFLSSAPLIKKCPHWGHAAFQDSDCSGKARAIHFSSIRNKKAGHIHKVKIVLEKTANPEKKKLTEPIRLAALLDGDYTPLRHKRLTKQHCRTQHRGVVDKWRDAAR
jgi:hypothetical protein